MNKELYFLRSSEQNIVNTLVKIAQPSELQNTYSKLYSLTTKDLGLYTLVNKEIAGAIWSRELDNTGIARLSVAIVPAFKNEGIGSFMMEQFLQEVATRYTEISIDISHKPKSLPFYEKFGFTQQNHQSSLILHKTLEKKAVVRPTDGYDSSRWMD